MASKQFGASECLKQAPSFAAQHHARQHTTTAGQAQLHGLTGAAAAAPTNPERLPPAGSAMRQAGGTSMVCAASLLELPDSVLQQHILPQLAGDDTKSLRLTCSRPRRLVNQCVRAVCVPAHALEAAPHARLGAPFPGARSLKAYDWHDATITDDALVRFLSQSGAWLAGLQELDLKRCLAVTGGLLAHLRAAAPRVRKLAPSRWTDHHALAQIALFPALEELDLGDADTDIVTVDDLGLSQLASLAPTLRVLRLARCRWVSCCDTLSALTQLEALDLSHTDVGALAALAALPRLKALNLTGCRNITDEVLQQLRGFPALSSLILRGTSTSNDGLRALPSIATLAHLDLGSKWELNDAGLAAVAACPRLVELAVGSFNLQRPVLGPRHNLKRLAHLSFGGGFANKGLHLLFPLLELQSLHITGIDSVTDAVMRQISASQRQLQRLALRAGYSLTPGGLAQLAALCNLAVLSVGACPAISRGALQAFTAAHARLGLLLEGCCPLLPDASNALCALAPDHHAAAPAAAGQAAAAVIKAF